ncbi:MAG: cytochrome P450 [Actinobacteria bacterium]|nr:cytochrome P450 [Actinomycetota bacterium]
MDREKVDVELRLLGLDGPDPYPGYRWLRDNQPVAWSGDADGWIVSRYEDVVAVLKDFETFRQVPFFAGGKRFVFDIDEPEHKPARRIYTAGASFSGSTIDGRIGAQISSIAEQAVGALPGARFDGMEDLVFPAVVEMIGRLFELPDPADSRIDWSASLTDTYPDPTSARGAEELAFVEDVIATRRAAPGNDPFSHIIRAKEASDEVSEKDLAWEIWDMIFAGGHSTVDQAGLALHALAIATDLQPGHYFSDAKRSKRAVEELLRFVPHVHYLRRLVAEPTEVAGVRLEAGQTVYALLASANHDEARWAEPDVLDLDRQGGPPVVTFGTGIHTTPGATFVRMALIALLREVFRRFESLTPAGPMRYDNLTHGGLMALACPSSLRFAG